MNKSDFFTKWEEEIGNIFSSAAINAEIVNKVQEAKPNFYNVYLINNQDIPVSFYVFILEEYFNLGKEDLVNSFNKLRSEGYVSYGLFTREIAENKISYIAEVSRSSGYSLKCIMCKDHGYVIEKP